MQRYSWRCASSIASGVSVSEPIWFTFTSRALAAPSFDTASQALGVGHEQVVTDNLDLVTNLLGQGLVALPVVLVQGIPQWKPGVLATRSA